MKKNPLDRLCSEYSGNVCYFYEQCINFFYMCILPQYKATDLFFTILTIFRYYTIRGKFFKVHSDLAKIGVKKIIIDFKKEMIGFIFNNSVDMDENGWTKLHHASFEGRYCFNPTIRGGGF